ncbi:hypothetical protein [Acidiferrobacter sp.]|uniref:hypothetical protein n=1 Tax=Acidiferrobacter sp. TaxID=1872107 RepID=UPI0026272187|nr:hypothetical protein [Acidiferrobacter sp.]
MNLIVLPLIAIPVLALAYRFLGRLAVVLGEGPDYNTRAIAGAGPRIVAGLHDLGVLGIPLLLAGAAFGLRFGWGPAVLAILLSGTTVGAASALAQGRLETYPAWRTVNTMARVLISAVLALVWTGLAVQGGHALLTFLVLYLAADRLIPLLFARRGDLVSGLILVAAIGVLFSAIGVFWPMAVAGSAHIAIGPYRGVVPMAPLFWYGLLFGLLILRKRAGRLAARPAYGAVGALLLGAVTVCLMAAALISHPPLTVPRLRPGHLVMALPLLPCALPMAASLAPLGDNPISRRPLSALYFTVLIGAGCAVGFLMATASGFANTASWARFFGHSPDAVALLVAGIDGSRRLLGTIGLGPWASETLRASLLLLTAAALESQQEALGRGRWPLGRIQPLAVTATLGGILWIAHGLGVRSELLIAATLAAGAALALIQARRAFPGFMVFLGYVLLVLANIAVIVIGWMGAAHHPVRAVLAVAVMTLEAVAAARIWGLPSRSEDHAPRSTGHQP